MISSRTANGSTAFRLVAGSALAVALLTGCASAGNADRVASAPRAAERVVEQAEESVESQPRDAALRVSLGQAYMKAGRFESAISAFNDALELGDQNPRTALSLALANVAIGRNDEAVAVLNDWREQIKPVDAGLAYALAGQTQRGTAILADAVRTSSPTPQARQNYAYALALEGRWREARIVMSQDLAPELINDRIGEWAALTSQDNSRIRVASLLGAPIRTDAGQPERLALAPGSAPAPEAQSADLAEPALAVAEVAPAPIVEQFPAPAAVVDQPQVAAASAQPGFVSIPVIQTLPVQSAGSSVAARSVPSVRKAAYSASVKGTHVVQLGSFTSEQGARKGWEVYAARNPALRSYRMTIIPATVNGKSYWRVAAGGLDAGTARSMCGSIKSRGGACLAYATTTAPADRGGPQMARRR